MQQQTIVLFFSDSTYFRHETFRRAHKRKSQLAPQNQDETSSARKSQLAPQNQDETSSALERPPPKKRHVPKNAEALERPPPQKRHLQKNAEAKKNKETSKSTKVTRRAWEIFIPKRFQIKRTLVAIVMAYFLALFEEGTDRVTWRMIRHVVHSNEKFHAEADTYLYSQLVPFAACVPPECESGELSEIFPFFDQKKVYFMDSSGSYDFNCQLHIFHSQTGTLLSSYPEIFDETRRQLYFTAHVGDNNELLNLSIIENICSFYKAFGVYCFFCNKFFRGRGTQHKCKRTLSCFACRRPFLTPKTYFTSRTKKYFCDSNLYPHVSSECPSCFMRIPTKHCNQHHKQRVCRWGITCQKCGTYIFQSKFVPKEKILDSHVCGSHQCYYCGAIEPKNKHLCHIRLPTFDKKFTNVGFFQTEFSGWDVTNCKECFELSRHCDICKETKKVPLVCSAYIEIEKRGHFDQLIFSHQTTPIILKDSLIFDYLPPSLKNSPISTESATRFGKKKKRRVHNSLFKEQTTVIEEFFYFLVKNSCANYTFVIFDDTRRIFEEIVKTLYKNGITPKVVGSPKILTVEIPALDIRFINFENYVNDSFSELADLFGEEKVFFPLRWLNDPKYFCYVGPPPKIDDFFAFGDCDKLVQEKECFAYNLKAPYDFHANFLKYVTFKNNVVAKAALSFLKESFVCQTHILGFLLPKREETYVHPFNLPLFTKAAYSYKLLCLFSNELKNVRILKSPVYMASSAGELEFCFYKIWEDPKKKYVHAWSPDGQEHFRESFPDLYVPEEKLCYYWNGCLVHGHCPENCTFNHSLSQKNMFGIKKKTALKEYEEKKQKMLENHPDIKIKEVWHCEWKKKKREDPKVKYFMKHIYRFPPLYRLDPRAAGMKNGPAQYLPIKRVFSSFQCVADLMKFIDAYGITV